jgi:hypothetical protein
MSVMVQFTTVGNHGRDFCTRVAACAVLAATWVVPLFPQTSSEFQDLLPELAAKVVAVVGSSSSISITASSRDSSSAEARELQQQFATFVSSRGARVVDAREGVTVVGISCSGNLRERSCLAEIQSTTRRDVVMVTRRYESTTPRDIRAPVSLELRPLFAQRMPILDVVTLDERLLVLDPASVTLYQQTGRGWQAARSRVLPISRMWPRDVRGRLRVEGDRFTAFLPGVTCSGRLNDLTFECTDGRQPWPIGIDNSGLEPARNYFSTPEGLIFYSAAPLATDADARWLVADRNGMVSFLDGSRRPLTRVASADDVAGIAAPCDRESYVLATERSEGREAVRLFQVVRQRLVPVASPVFVPGTLTALWTTPAAMAVIAVAHDASSERYEAFLATVSCGR